jgi:membrane protease YdiL (CAAX protease family)
MTTLRDAIVRWPIGAYVLIAFGASWALTPLVSISVLFGLLALFGPALAALIVTLAEGRSGDLRARVTDWRQPIRWYLLAFAIPFGVAAAALGVYLLLGGNAPGLSSVTAIELLIFVLVIGEEIGWRGFLQPRFRARMGLGRAGLATGLVWALWHLPIYLQPEQGLAAFAVFAWYVLPLAVVIGFVAERARNSVIVATVIHGAANIATVILLPGVDRQWMLLVTGAVYVAVAVAAVGLANRDSPRGLSEIAATT